MITVLLQKIIDMLSQHFPAAITLLSKLNLIEEDTEEIRGNVDSMKTTLEDVDTQTTAAATKLNTINTTVTSIDSNTAAIKTNSDAIKNNILSMSSNVGNIAAYSEDTANNTLDIDQKITSIASDTTDIRTATNDIYDENAKIYDAVKWLLADKEIEETERGDNSVTFDTDMTEDLTGLTVGLVATQSGTGSPTPDNIRDIVGYSSVGLTVNGSLITISLGNTYYSGTLNVITGSLIIDKVLQIYDDTNNWDTYATGENNVYRLTNAAGAYTPLDIEQICNLAVVNSNANIINVARTNTFILGTQSLALYIQLSASDFPTVADFKTFLNSNNMKVLYNITPIIITLTPQQIATIKGVNTITTDTNGEIVVTYKESIKHYLDKQEN